MKIIQTIQLNHTQLVSQKSGESYSLSAVISNILGSEQLFIHHDIIKEGSRSSGAHRHSLLEEVIYVIKGTVTVVEGKNQIDVSEGGLILFDPKDQDTHFLENRSGQNIETLTFMQKSEFDKIIFDQQADFDFHLPAHSFDQNLREIPEDKTDWKTFIEKLKAKLKTDIHPAEKLFLYEHIGVAARILLKLDEAEFYLKKALAVSYKYPSQSRLIQNLIRLAHVYQWKNEFEKSQVSLIVFCF